MQKAIRAVAYIRVGTKERTEVELSVFTQLEAIRNCCKQKGWELVHEYTDIGKSAITNERPEFQQMIEMAKQPNRDFDVIIVDRFSRFSRNIYDLIAHMSILKEAGVTIYSATELGSLETPYDFLPEETREFINSSYNMYLKSRKMKRRKQ